MKKSAIFIALTLLIASSVDAILRGDYMINKPYFARITFRQAEVTPIVLLQQAGSIVSQRFVLTARSNLTNLINFQVYVGSAHISGQRAYAGTQLPRITSLPEGLGLIQTQIPIVFSINVQPIRMVPSDRSVGIINEEGMVLGMTVPGPNPNTRLLAAFLRIIHPIDCANYYTGIDVNAFFCAYDNYRSDFCEGDRGSGFTILHRGEEMLAGIALEGACILIDNLPIRPSLFINVAHFRDSINDILNGRPSK